MATLKDHVNDLNQMILEGKIIDAFEKYYAEDVVMQDNETPQREGKEACRQFEHDFVNKLTEFRGAEVKNVLVAEDAGVAAVEWHFDYTHADWGERKYDQVAVQRWKDGKIVSEKFVYNG